MPVQYVADYEYTGSEDASIGQLHVRNQGDLNICEREINETVDSLLNALPKRCREIYNMSRRDNLSITEIAQRLNISKRTVENQLTTALKHLRATLKYVLLLGYFIK